MSLVRLLLYLKLCVGRTHSHAGSVLTIVNLALLLKLSLGLSGFHAFFLGLVVLAVAVVAGHLDLLFGVFRLEKTLENEHNAELLAILNNSKK